VSGIVVRPIEDGDRRAWQDLWRGYLDFYRAAIGEDVTELTWRRFLDPDEPMFAAVALRAGEARPIGLVHWLTHRSTWAKTSYAYLEDLFVAPGARGGGIGRALIEHVYAEARNLGCEQVYWLTHETNAAARRLYDKIAERTGMLHYARSDLGGA
jgi:GNAT superfamily N-acetyltransferase